MINVIPNNGLSVNADYTKTAKTKLKEVAEQPAPPASTPEDRVEVSDSAMRALAQSGFDAAKVASIKKAIADGNYPLNARRIAESFTALENMMDSAVKPVQSQGQQK